MRACFARTCCTVVVQEHDLRATPVQCNSKRTLSLHCILRSSHPALHTSHLHFTLHTSPHLKSCELFSPHLTSSQLFSSHMSSKYISSSQLFSSHPSTDQRFSFPRSSSQLVSAVLHARKLLLSEVSCTKNHWTQKAFCTQKLETQVHLHRKAFTKYFVRQSLHKILPSTTLYYKAWTLHYTDCTQYFPLLCTTKACALYY